MLTDRCAAPPPTLSPQAGEGERGCRGCMPHSVAVIGAGAWGTALATVAARAGRSVTLYARDAGHAKRIATTRENPRLPGIKLAADIAVTNDLAQAARADIILVVTPAQHLRAASNAIAPHLRERTPVIACAKGIEHGTHKFMTDIIAESAPHAVPAILSGPSFADDVARGLADRGDAGGKGRGARRRPGAGAGLGDLPALSHHGCARRRDRRRGQERAGDRGRHRGRQEARRLRAGRADHARLLRAGAVRPRARRARGNHGRACPASAT